MTPFYNISNFKFFSTAESSVTAKPAQPEVTKPAASINNEQVQSQWQALLATPEIPVPNNQTNILATATDDQQLSLHENNQLLRALTNYIVKENR